MFMISSYFNFFFITSKHVGRKSKKKPCNYTCRTEVRPSTIKGAGMGLFLLEDAEPGDRVAIYTGDVLTEEETKNSASNYLLRISRKVTLDSSDPSHEKGRYMNDGKRSGRKVNCVFGAGTHPSTCRRTGRKYISIRAKCHIRASALGTELLINYGRSYWNETNVMCNDNNVK